MTYISDIYSQQFMIDSLSIKAHSCASGYEINGNQINALGRSAGGLTTKIHTLIDALGNPIRFIVTVGNVHDIVPAQKLLEGITHSYITADKSYFFKENIKFLEQNKNKPIVTLALPFLAL